MSAPSTNRGRANVYREAARIMEDRDTNRSCYAVMLAQGMGTERFTTNPHVVDYKNAMLNGTYTTAALPWNEPFDCDEDMDVRVLLLCFMAAMVEAGDA